MMALGLHLRSVGGAKQVSDNATTCGRYVKWAWSHSYGRGQTYIWAKSCEVIGVVG